MADLLELYISYHETFGQSCKTHNDRKNYYASYDITSGVEFYDCSVVNYSATSVNYVAKDSYYSNLRLQHHIYGTIGVITTLEAL